MRCRSFLTAAAVTTSLAVGVGACLESNVPTEFVVLVCAIDDTTGVDFSQVDSLKVDGCKVPEDSDHDHHGHDH